MSLIQTTATTAASTAATSLVTSLWNHIANHANYLIKFEDAHDSLTDKIIVLKSLRDQVKRRVEADEVNEMTRTPVVDGWLQRVEATEQEVDLLVQEGSRQIQRIGGCCHPNWWACYKLGKTVSKKLPVVEELISSGKFDNVADKSLPSPAQIIPGRDTVGMDAKFNEVWKLLGEEKVNVIGIYGMGGVGKTTLLKRIHNAFVQIAQNVDVVIWVVVSKEFSLPNIQDTIGKKLGLIWSEDERESEKARRIFNVLMKKKFVLLLDDIWQPLDLVEGIGVPNSNSKVVFTTRSESVCRSMEVKDLVKISKLDWDQAWIFFQQKVGPVALGSHPEIPKLAEKIAKLCDGLPLALITIGRAMATKKTLSAWNIAIRTLERSFSEFSGMEQRVLATLKFSYDSLESDTVRKCFLYFSLYPEDFIILKNDIILQWIGEGFFDEFEDYNDAFDKGHDIIGSLQVACLLEGSTNTLSEKNRVTMYDIVRETALWIACECGEKKNKYLVQADVGLTGAPNVQSWKGAERISLNRKNIRELRETPECPYLQTLFLTEDLDLSSFVSGVFQYMPKYQGNYGLSSIASAFFQYMPNLRVLKLSVNQITEVPKSIGYLVELRYLDVKGTRIRTLPEEVGNLTKLRLLEIEPSTSLPRGMISRFSKLQRLNLQGTGFSGDADICYPSVAELECLEHLRDLAIDVRDLPTLESMCLSPRLRLCLRVLKISMCHGLTQVNLAPSSLFGKLKRLERFIIEQCYELEEVRIGYVKEENNEIGLLPSLYTLGFWELRKMNIIWNDELLCFKNLACVAINRCDALKDISWLVLAPVLEDLMIFNCRELEDILFKINDTTLSKLESLDLGFLPKLASISRVALPLPSLKQVRVYGCPLLKKLPFTSNSTKKPFLQIYGETGWWNELEWEEETVKSSFQAFFKQEE